MALPWDSAEDCVEQWTNKLESWAFSKATVSSRTGLSVDGAKLHLLHQTICSSAKKERRSTGGANEKSQGFRKVRPDQVRKTKTI